MKLARSLIFVLIPITCVVFSTAFMAPRRFYRFLGPPRLYQRESSAEKCRVQGTQSDCCNDITMEPPYFYEEWKQMLDVLEALDRPWFASGGFTLFAVRLGGFGFKYAEEFVTRDSEVKSEQHNRWINLMDGDMDFTIIFRDEEDRSEKYREVSELCEDKDKLRCSRNWPDNGSSTVWENSGNGPAKMCFTLWSAYLNGTDHLTINSIANYPYDMPVSRILPTKYAKFHDSWIRVPNDFMWAFSHFRPYSVPAPSKAIDDNRNVEYGMGCLEMAYPTFLVQSAGVPKNRPINQFPQTDYYDEIRRMERGLVNCAFCLQRHGCASFTSCFEQTLNSS